MLCCDRYHIFAYHTILTYQKLWPTNRFTFYIPWCDKKPQYIIEDNVIGKDKVVFVKTSDSSFKGTMKTLLENIDDEEFIYWCTSDQYLVRMDNKIADTIENMLDTVFYNTSIYGISNAFLKKSGRKLIKPAGEVIKGAWGGNMVEKYSWSDSKTITLWFHQYLRAKVLKHIFNAFTEPRVAKALDKQLYSNSEKIYNFPSTGRYFTIDTNIAEFGENTSRGKILKNTIESFHKYGIDVTKSFEIMDKELYWK